MKNDAIVWITRIAFILSLVLLTGCGTTDDSRFYLLTPEGEGEMGDGSQLALGIGPIQLPDYLDRPQIVTRSGGNEILLAEYDRWAEALDGNLTRVLAENLSHLLNTDRITLFPWDGPMDFRVAVDIIRFDTDEEGNVTLIARLSLHDETGEGTGWQHKRTVVHTSGEAGDYRSLVSAHSEALALLCKEIAGMIVP